MGPCPPYNGLGSCHCLVQLTCVPPLSVRPPCGSAWVPKHWACTACAALISLGSAPLACLTFSGKLRAPPGLGPDPCLVLQCYTAPQYCSAEPASGSTRCRTHCPFGPSSSHDEPRPCASWGLCMYSQDPVGGPFSSLVLFHFGGTFVQEAFSGPHSCQCGEYVLLTRCLLPRPQASRVIAPTDGLWGPLG